MDARLPGPGLKYVTGDADEVTKVEQLLKQGIVEGFVFARGNVITTNVYLDPAGAVLNTRKRSLAHNAASHQAAGNGDFLVIGRHVFLVKLRLFVDFVGQVADGKSGGGKGLNAQFADLGQVISADEFLFAAFHFIYFGRTKVRR